MKTLLLPLLAVAVLLAPAFGEDEPQSENQAKTVRAPDGKFVQVPLAKGVPAPKEAQAKKDDQPAGAVETIDAAQVEKLKGMEGKTVKVRGKVHEVFVPKAGSVAVLNLGKDFKSCFKVAIPKASFGKFGGLDEIKKAFDGKAVTVEGKVVLYREMPQIEATVPSQIKAGE